MIALDVDSDNSVQSGVKELLDETGRLDVLVNNAGYVLTGGVEETSIEEAKSQFETDFFGPVRMTKAVLPTMRKQGAGLIVNIPRWPLFYRVPSRVTMRRRKLLYWHGPNRSVMKSRASVSKSR